jgi:hypothetical protein
MIALAVRRHLTNGCSLTAAWVSAVPTGAKQTQRPSPPRRNPD